MKSFLLGICIFVTSSVSLVTVQILNRPPEWYLKLHPVETEADLRGLASKVAKKFKIDVDLFIALIEVESNFSTEVRSKAGAVGLTQVMPENAKRVGLSRVSELWNPYFNLRSGAIILSQEYAKVGNWRGALKNYLCFDKTVCGGAADAYADKVMARVGSKKL